VSSSVNFHEKSTSLSSESGSKRLRVMEGMGHEILHETGWESVVEEANSFIAHCVRSASST
jgi:alpha-beta hydrolase superfamily lysophospholipase